MAFVAFAYTHCNVCVGCDGAENTLIVFNILTQVLLTITAFLAIVALIVLPVAFQFLERFENVNTMRESWGTDIVAISTAGFSLLMLEGVGMYMSAELISMIPPNDDDNF